MTEKIESVNELVERINGELTPDISHPSRYTTGSIECWDYIIDKDMNYLEGNIIKYVTRYKHKNGKEDLLKAREYLDKLIQTCDDGDEGENYE